jgi:Mn2+/Fe2+ NRAMP family transporter
MMITKRLFYKILIGIAAGMLLLFLLKVFVVEPWVKERIQSAINKSTGAYLLKIEKVHISVIRSGIES